MRVVLVLSALAGLVYPVRAADQVTLRPGAMWCASVLDFDDMARGIGRDGGLLNVVQDKVRSGRCQNTNEYLSVYVHRVDRRPNRLFEDGFACITFRASGDCLWIDAGTLGRGPR